MRNSHFSGKDESSSKGKFLYYVIRQGWVRDIVDSYSTAWVHTVNYQDFTKCPSHPNGIPSKYKGFQSYKEAVAYLGCDPATGSPLAQQIDHKPPKRDLPLSTIVGLNLRPDPHQWCGTHVMAMAITIKGSNCPAVNEVDDKLETSITSNTLAALSATINKALKDNTDAVLKATSSQGRPAKKKVTIVSLTKSGMRPSRPWQIILL